MSDDWGFTVAKVPNGVLLTLAIGGAALAYIVADHLHTPYDPDFDEIGAKYGVPSNLLRALARVESGFNPAARNPKTGTYPAGNYDVGLMQVNTTTGSRLGYTAVQLGAPRTSIEAAARLLVMNRQALGNRYSPQALAASYNVGVDLKPADVGAAYAAKVLYHWNLYDMGRVLA